VHAFLFKFDCLEKEEWIKLIMKIEVRRKKLTIINIPGTTTRTPPLPPLMIFL